MWDVHCEVFAQIRLWNKPKPGFQVGYFHINIKQRATDAPVNAIPANLKILLYLFDVHK